MYTLVEFESRDLYIIHIRVAITTWLEAVTTAVFLVTHWLDFGVVVS